MSKVLRALEEEAKDEGRIEGRVDSTFSIPYPLSVCFYLILIVLNLCNLCNLWFPVQNSPRL